MRRIIPVLITSMALLVHTPAAQAVEGAKNSAIPSWFKTSFMDLPEDIKEAAQDSKRLMVYFHQEGCPYCAELVNNNFSQKRIVDYMTKHIDAIEIDMWGDREVTAIDGTATTEKQFAAANKVWFTPTLLFFNEKGDVILRLNGYYPPHHFLTALHYVGEKQENKHSFRDYYAEQNPPKSTGKLHDSRFFMQPPYDLSKRKGSKPLAVFFEQKDCPDCDAVHQHIMPQPATQEQLKRLDVVQLDMWSDTPVVMPDGKRTTARKWASELGVVYAPTVVMFDDTKEIIRMEAMLKSYHFQSILDYAASRAYKTHPSLQRFLSQRAEQITEHGGKVNIWD